MRHLAVRTDESTGAKAIGQNDRRSVSVVPRIIRHRDAPAYLGVDRNRFDAEIRPLLTEIPIGMRGRAFDRLELDAWADRMADALRDRLPDRARNLALGACTGQRELMASDGDRDEALAICNRGLLASMEVGRDAFAAIGRRVIQQVIEPLADAAQDWEE